MVNRRIWWWMWTCPWEPYLVVNTTSRWKEFSSVNPWFLCWMRNQRKAKPNRCWISLNAESLLSNCSAAETPSDHFLHFIVYGVHHLGTGSRYLVYFDDIPINTNSNFLNFSSFVILCIVFLLLLFNKRY